MDLPTHFAFAFAVGLFFFNKPEIALLVALGAIFPDLDREYWFMPSMKYAEEQIHRAGLHNIFIMGLAYLISPYFSLGIFLHIFQDSFTTVKDRGVEWFFPLTRLVKRGLYDSDGKKQPLDPKEKVYLYQEDSRGLVEKADPDLREYGCDPVPWRRVYGFAQNSQIVDRGFLYSSIVLILIWNFAPGYHFHLVTWSAITSNFYLMILIAYASVITLFVSGELDRHDKKRSQKVQRINFIKYPIFGFGAILFGFWLILFWSEIKLNLLNIFSNPIAFSLEVILVPLTVVLMIIQKRGKYPAVV